MSTKRPRYIEINGQRYSMCFSPEIVKSAITYKPTASDVFVATYPKCGTTWMIQIAMLVLRKGKLPASIHDYFSSCPFFEMLGPEVIKDMPGPGCLKTHLPFQMVPYSPDAKYIYVARHPRDCVISFYHHTKSFPGYYFSEGTFDDFFDSFIKGEVDFGDYFDHLLSWYEHRNDPNVFFTTFEDMKADHRGTVLKVAKFLGDQYARGLEEDEKLLDDMVHKSSLQFMRDITNEKWNEIVVHPREIMNNPKMPEGLRKWAKVTADALADGEKPDASIVRNGDGSSARKIQLTPDQEKRLQERILEKTKNSDVMRLWK